MPEPETRLWLELRAARFRGIKFRRQKVIGKFIADFAANDPKLVIELDGDTHAGREGYDEIRTRFLEEQGYTVIRFSNSDVMGNMGGVLERLAQIFDGMGCSPLPTLSPEGERALGGATNSLSPSGKRVGERGKS
jgi:very-short-patch-repair endonuclease